MFQVPTSYSTTYSGYAWVRSKITTSCCVVFGSIVCRLRIDELPQDWFVVQRLLVHQCVLPSAICICWSSHCPMTRWVCQWKTFWIPVDDSFKKAYVEDWVFQITDPSDISLRGGQGDVILETPKVSLPVSSSQREAPKPEVSTCAQEHVEAPLPPLQPRSTCERLELPFSCDAFERIQASSSLASGVNKFFSCQSPMQKRLSVYNWNPGPRRGGKNATEKQVAGKWHLITLQEAADYVEYEILHERFHLTHFAGCAVLFNKDTFYSDISVKSIYLHDTRRCVQDHVVEGDHGWVLQGVLSRASFRRAAASGQKVFTVLSLHINSVFPTKRGIAKKIIQTVRALLISQNIDLVAGDFNGAAWRCRSRDHISTIDEVFSDCLAFDAGPHTIVGPGSIPSNWADVCGFLKLPGSQRFWKVSKHGAFSIPRQALGLRSSDQSCHHETWLHLHFVDWNNKWSQQAHYNGNIRLKERPQKRHISELLSDHSLSS